jgi:polyferredoxin
MPLLENLTALKKDLYTYARLQLRQYQFEAIEWVAKERARLLLNLLFALLALLIVAFASLFAAMLLNAWLSSTYFGFGIVALGWILISTLLFYFRKSLFQRLVYRYLDQNIPA